MYANNNLYFVGNLVTEIYIFKKLYYINYNTLYYITFNYITLHYITLHYITLQNSMTYF